MREIIFKGKRKDNGEWVEGGYCIYDGKTYIIIFTRYMPDTRDWDEADYYENNKIYKNNLIEVFPETVGQYIGKEDDNGVKVFEMDMIHTIDNFAEYDAVIEYSSKYTAFVAKSRGGTSTRWNMFGHEVISNIHDKDIDNG